MLQRFGVVCLLAILIAGGAQAQNVRITQDMENRSFDLDGTRITIARVQNEANRLSSEFTKTSRPCPPFCIMPMSAGEGIETMGELEVLDFLEDHVAPGTGLLIDSRLPEWFGKGSIPGAINLPFSTLAADNPYRDEILQALGGVKVGTGWDYSGAFKLAIFCNGPWCEQASIALTNLTTAGYPAEKLSYYRGGMQNWLQLGLTTTN